MNTTIYKYFLAFFLFAPIHIWVCHAKTTVTVQVDGNGNVDVCNADNNSQCFQQYDEGERYIDSDRQLSSASCNSVEKFVQKYYSDYQRGDVRSMVDKWLTPPENVIKTVRDTEWCGIPHTKLIRCTKNTAIVYVGVTTKHYYKQPKRWFVNVYLKNVYGKWLITSIKQQK